eukprot:scaffold330266_cov18-Prasinocladus_malaysianus.AAC.1
MVFSGSLTQYEYECSYPSSNSFTTGTRIWRPVQNPCCCGYGYFGGPEYSSTNTSTAHRTEIDDVS